MISLSRFATLALALFYCQAALATPPPDSQKPRLFVLTDIENEPDDAQSLVRLLVHSNHYQIEGLAAVTSIWLPNRTAPQRIHRILDSYQKVAANLALHEPGFPDAQTLQSKITNGPAKWGMQGVGPTWDSSASTALIAAVDSPDPRPLWVTAWGGTNVLAQALWKVRQTRSPQELAEFVSKIRVYAISDQDDSGPWIRKTFPKLFYIVSPGYGENDGGGYHHATWTGISGDRFHGNFDGADFSLVTNDWLDQNVIQNHGPLGQEYPHWEYLMEGDTPSFLYLFPNGLASPEHPDFGSWGGRYEYYTPPMQDWFHEPETRPIWTNAIDAATGTDGQPHNSIYATIWRWRQAYQNEFAARMDWCTQTPAEANHPPIAQLSHPLRLSGFPGETIALDASPSSDPDGDSLSYNWSFYREPSTFKGSLKIENANQAQASITLPAQGYPATGKVYPKTVHIILAVTDSGTPALTRYQRVILTIEKPNSKPRTIVTTDGEVDDKSSFIRYLLYANEFETEGLIYGNSKWQRHGHGTTWMQDSIDLYGQVRDKLLIHRPDYPTVEALKNVVYAGNMDEDFLNYTGIRDTPGSDHIVATLLDKDPRPLWIQAWGGTNTIAQALSRLRESYPPEVIENALSKLRIFAIAVQDDTGIWIREQFPEATFLLSHQFVALNYQHEGHPYSNHPIFDEAWITENAKNNHGPLAASYPQAYFSEGDSPAFFDLIGNGLRAYENPRFGGWGGRYEKQGNSQTFYYDAPDDGDKFKAQWRWLLDIQNDFQARLDWCVNDFENANHPPVATLKHPENLTLSAGQSITLDASGSSDPDGDTVSYSWMHYQGPGSFTGDLEITNANTPTCTITAPKNIPSAQTAHIILTLADDGSPVLKSYRRIILTLQP